MTDLAFTPDPSAQPCPVHGTVGRCLIIEADHRSVMANVRLGKWMSAALDDPKVCDAMKDDIREWFSAGHPPHALTKSRGEA